MGKGTIGARPSLSDLQQAPPVVRRLEVAQLMTEIDVLAEPTVAQQAIYDQAASTLQKSDISAEEVVALWQQFRTTLGGQTKSSTSAA
jgi:hypothetical protein